MAIVQPTSHKDLAPTRLRLQAINQDFSDFDEQVRQAAHIIGLPDEWPTIKDEETRLEVIKGLVRARVEWVLRWILDKLKDETQNGRTARRNGMAWKLLDWMIHVLPVSRSAPHLRDASFPTILERTLLETFDRDSSLQTTSSDDDVLMRNVSESSETLHEDSSPSRKRKRGPHNSSSASRVILASTQRDRLFQEISSTIASILSLALANSKTEDTTQAELMKMVLRTESAQASRILRFWLSSVHQLISTKLSSTVPVSNQDHYLDLSLVMSIWELRAIDPKDETGTSAEDFSTECLVPTLTLLDNMRVAHHSGSTRFTQSVIGHTTQALDRLLARHLLVPSRAAFLADAPTEATKSSVGVREAKDFANYLQPLRAKLLQAARIEDADESLPDEFLPLYNSIPHLLDLTIRASPSRTPKGRLVEKPWIQATFQALAECSGCPLSTAPIDIIHQSAITALEGTLQVLQANNVSIDSEVLTKIFWYHCGVKYPEQQKKKVHWSLIGSLIKLDPSVFATEPKSNPKDSQTRQDDLADFIFDQIADAQFDDFIDDEPISNDNAASHNSGTDNQVEFNTSCGVIARIIVPLLLAFAHNRNLLGFFRRWDRQLVKRYKNQDPKALQKHKEVVWEDRAINRALVDIFEQSLTRGQIASLIQEHAKRMAEVGDAIEKGKKSGGNKELSAYKKASSSAVIIPAILQSVHSDETIEALQPQLHSLFQSYFSWVQADDYRYQSRLAFSWFTLCQLLDKLWASELHTSLRSQQNLLYPLIEQATKDMSISRKDQSGRRVDSLTRAAAMLFLLEACSRLQTSSGSENIIQTTLRKVMKSLSSSRLEVKEYSKMLELFCASFADLLNHFDEDTSSQSLLTLLTRLSKIEGGNDLVCKSLSATITINAKTFLRNAFSKALMDSLEQENDISLHVIGMKALSYIHPLSLRRENRESILDRLTDLLILGQNEVEQVISTMIHLLAVPNATAKISTNGKILFDIAEQLHKRDMESLAVLRQFRVLILSVLGHVLSDQNQAQNRSYLEVVTAKLNQLVKAPEACSAARLSVLRSATGGQTSNPILNLGRYVDLLKQCLTNNEFGSEDTVSHCEVLDAFNELTQPALVQAKIWDRTQTWLRTWINEHSGLQPYLSSGESNPIDSVEYVARLHTTIAKFGLYSSTNWFLDFTLRILDEPISDDTKRAALEATKDIIGSLPTPEKLSLTVTLMDASNSKHRASSFQILNNLIATLDDKIEPDNGIKQKQLALLPRIAVLLVENSDHECFFTLLGSINVILNDKPSLASQYSIECILSVLAKFTSRSSPAVSIQYASDIFSHLCETSRLILLVHRGRMGGRLHLLLPLLQGLLFCLFIPNASRSGALPSWLRTITATDPVRLTLANASQYSRLLSTLCNPPQSSITKAHQHHASRKSKDLNDPVKAAREKISHFMYPLLASFCRFQLNGRLDSGVREKLMPGIWEVVKTASLHKEGLDAMFAGLGRSERDVWRGIWAEWDSMHGRTRLSAIGDEI